MLGRMGRGYMGEGGLEQEEPGGAGVGGGGGGEGAFWWDLVGMRVGSELPKTEKRQFLVGFLDRVE